jgi:YgiT-type zinc finger domain-containing protein
MTEPDDLCDLCGGELRAGTTRLDVWRGDELVVITDVPADVCQQCGEAYIAAEVAKRVERFLPQCRDRVPQRYLTVPEYSAEEGLAS